MFGIIRLIFWGIIFVASLFAIQKFNVFHKKRYILLICIIILVLWSISGMIPIENTFVTFSSPESAYSYMNSEKVKLVIYGQETALVIGQKDTAEFVELIVPKADTGWKLGRGLDIKIVNKLIVNEVAVCIYRYKNSNDYYVVASSINNGEIDITDNRNSEFYLLEENSSSSSNICNTYYAYVHKLDEEYLLRANGNTISFDK